MFGPGWVRAAEAGQLLTPEDAKELWTATYVLMGSRYDKAMNQKLPQGVMQMRGLVAYQAIVEEGFVGRLAKGKTQGIATGTAQGIALGVARGITMGVAAAQVDEARRMVRRIGDKRFGRPSLSVEITLDAEESLDRLERMADRLLEVETWDELLATE